MEEKEDRSREQQQKTGKQQQHNNKEEWSNNKKEDWKKIMQPQQQHQSLLHGQPQQCSWK